MKLEALAKSGAVSIAVDWAACAALSFGHAEEGIKEEMKDRNYLGRRTFWAAGLAVLASSAASASTTNIMAIGDSLTWGLTYADGDIKNTASVNYVSEGAWRSPLQNMLGSNYAFRGLKGDGILSSGEQSGSGQDGDEFDGPNGKVARHEGYSGWFIDDSIITPSVLAGLPDQQGIRQNLRTASNASGTIDPAGLNSGVSSDIVMLFLGVNDVGRFELGGLKSSVTVEGMVDNLMGLITDIKIAYNGTGTSPTILVSNLTYFASGTNLRESINLGIADFNAELLSRFESGWLDDNVADSLDHVYATTSQAGFEEVFLLNATAAIDPSTDLLGDGVHFNATGNSSIAQFYYDRFDNGVVIPEPSSLALVGLSFALISQRRRRT